MKVIDLLNKIAKEEEVPKMIRFEGEIYKFTGYDGEYRNYINLNSFDDLFECLYGSLLNEKVEILKDTPKENKNIEKIKDYSIMKTTGFNGETIERKIPKDFKLQEIASKINEIIDGGEENVKD